MKPSHLLQDPQNKAIEDKYSKNPLFCLLHLVCTPIYANAKSFAVLSGELFYNCIYTLDTLKGKSYQELNQASLLIWSEIVIYLREKNLSMEDKEVFQGAALIAYSVSRAFLLSRKATYTYFSECISQQLAELDASFVNTLRRRFNLAISKVGENQLSQWLSNYLLQPDNLSDEIEKLIDATAQPLAKKISFIVNAEKSAAVLGQLNTYMSGKSTPKDIMMPVRAAFDAGVIRKPTYSEFKKLFPTLTPKSKSSFDDYLKIDLVGNQHPYYGIPAFEKMVKVFSKLKEETPITE